MKKKILAIVLALVLVFGTLTFVGCGSKDDFYHDEDNWHRLTFSGNNYTYVKTNEQLYLKMEETSTGTFTKDGNKYTFNENSLVVKHYVKDTLVYELAKEPSTFWGKDMPDDMIKTSRNGVLYKGDFRPYLYANINMEYKGFYDIFFQKNSDIETIISRIKNTILYKSKDLIWPENIDISPNDVNIDVSKTGETTLKFTFEGKEYSFDAFVTEGNPDGVNFHGYNTISISGFPERNVEIGTTFNDWFDNWFDEYSTMSITHNGENYKINMNDVVVSGWKADIVTEKTKFDVTFSTTHEGKVFSTVFSIVAYNPGDTEFTRAISDPVASSYKASSPMFYNSDFDFYVLPTNQDISIIKQTNAINDRFTPDEVVASETEHISDYIDISTPGVKKFTLQNEFAPAKNYVVYVYDSNKQMIKKIGFAGSGFSSGIIYNGQLIDGPAIEVTYAGKIFSEKLDYEQTKMKIVYSKARMQRDGYSPARIYATIKIDGKEYTFSTSMRTLYEHNG